MKEKKYDVALDGLRVIAIFAVLAIHTTTRELELTHYDLLNNLVTLFLNQISRFAVPLFFMISGFALELSQNSQLSYVSYLKKRLNKIFIPYVFWSAIYFFLIYRIHTDSFLTTLATGSASYQLYFIPSLLIFYAIFPFIHKFYNFFANKFALIVLGAIEVYLLYYDYKFHTSTFPYPIAVFLFNYYVFILGVVAVHYKELILRNLNRWIIIFVPLLLFAGFFVFNEGKTNYLTSYNYLAFYSQWRPSIFIYTILFAGVLYFLFSKIKSKIAIYAIKKLSEVSFFVFFIHVIILEILSPYVASLKNDLMFFGLVAIISTVVGFSVHKVPYLAKLTG